MNRTGQVVLGEFAFFAHIDQQELIAAVHPGFHGINVGFANPRSRVVNEFQKPGRMLMGHESLLFCKDESLFIVPSEAAFCMQGGKTSSSMNACWRRNLNARSD